MLKRLETTYAVRDTVLDWFVSYLSDRSQSVIVDGVVSASRLFVYGVPQGSVLGPVLFTLYSQPLSCTIPDIWKLSTVIPIPKKDNPKLANDFRPIALTSLVMKTLEKKSLSSSF